jgi:hypothetical protein
MFSLFPCAPTLAAARISHLATERGPNVSLAVGTGRGGDGDPDLVKLAVAIERNFSRQDRCLDDGRACRYAPHRLTIASGQPSPTS